METFATLAEVAPKPECLFHRKQHGLCFEAATAVYVDLPSYGSGKHLVSSKHTPYEEGWGTEIIRLEKKRFWGDIIAVIQHKQGGHQKKEGTKVHSRRLRDSGYKLTLLIMSR